MNENFNMIFYPGGHVYKTLILSTFALTASLCAKHTRDPGTYENPYYNEYERHDTCDECPAKRSRTPDSAEQTTKDSGSAKSRSEQGASNNLDK